MREDRGKLEMEGIGKVLVSSKVWRVPRALEAPLCLRAKNEGGWRQKGGRGAG